MTSFFYGPEVVRIVEKATPFYAAASEKLIESTTFVRDNMEPAKAVLLDICSSAKSSIAEQGVVSYAKSSAEHCKTQTMASVEVLKSKGAVEGAREVGCVMLMAVATALDEHKTKTHVSSEINE